MTARQKQLILCCFDILPLDDVDGIWGPKSTAGMECVRVKFYKPD